MIDRPDDQETGEQFDQRLRATAADGPGFAGHYALVLWSCGMPCYSFAIVDVRNGKVFGPPFNVVECGWNQETQPDLISYRINSRLMIIRGRLETHDSTTGTEVQSPCGTYYFETTRTGLKQLKFTPMRNTADPAIKEVP